jgi:hypothetical protein
MTSDQDSGLAIVPPNWAAVSQWRQRHSNRMLETSHAFEDLVRALSGAGT